MSVPKLIFALLAVSASASIACVQPGLFACESSDNCISRGEQGVCEPTGFCSYPSGECESGHRYDEFAREDLAGRCIDEAGELEEESDGGSDGGTPDPEVCMPPPPPPACADADGDGFGEGECLGLDCDDDNPSHHDRCVYISPAGDDHGAGTRDAPWLTFAHAIPQLGPGESLVLLDGDYEPSTTGLPNIDCDETGNAVSGMPLAPISIRAESERRARLLGDGSQPVFRLDDCRHWGIFGLAGRGADLSAEELEASGLVFQIDDSEDVVARRLHFSHSNRYFESHVFVVSNSHRILIEESEAYDFHLDGFHVEDASTDVTLRRCYARGSDYADLPGCVRFDDPIAPFCSVAEGEDSGDTAFDVSEGSSGVRMENCIADGPLWAGFQLGPGVRHSEVLGSIVQGGLHGVVLRGDEATNMAVGVIDSVIDHPRRHGVWMRSTQETWVDGLTVIGAGGDALKIEQETPCPEIGGCSCDLLNVLALDSVDHGVSSTSAYAWRLSYANVYGSGEGDYPVGEEIGDEEGDIWASMSVDPGPIGTGEGQRLVYAPDDSPMKGAGAMGDDIGGTVLHRVVEGDPTDEPLWDPETGAFPCGATVSGVSDDPERSCIGVHERLGLGAGAAALPSGYGEICG